MVSRADRDAFIDILAKAGVEDAGFEVDLVIKHVTGQTRFELEQLTETARAEICALLQRRAQRYPLQYLLGSWSFLDLELKVGEGVLIPRPETEEVCLAAVEMLAGQAAPVVLDLCAGSGALALGIQSHCPGAAVTAVELHEAALAYLRENVSDFHRGHSTAPTVVQADALTYYKGLPAGSVDLIVSNPPYVTASEYAQLAPELCHEPRQALVPQGGEADGLLFYRTIAQQYAASLAPGGALVFEIGAAQGEAVRHILAQAGYADIAVRQDLAGKDRVVLARRPLS